MLSYGSIKVNPDSCIVTYQDQVVSLLPKEYKLLVLFLQYPNHILTYDVIINRLWDVERTPIHSSIRSHIKGIRKAFKKVDAETEIIQTIHGMGYRLNPLLQKRDLENQAILPPLPILKNFLRTKAIEYFFINKEWIIQYISPGLKDYCDYPESLKVGSYVGDSFPELIGFEELLEKVRSKEEPTFELRGVARSVNPKRPDYINFYGMANGNPMGSKEQNQELIFIFIEDTSEQMRYKQRIVQLENQIYLLLEVSSKDILCDRRDDILWPSISIGKK